MNPMGLGTPWADAYLEPQQKERFSLMFINIFITNATKHFQGLTQWDLVPLGPMLIYHLNKNNNPL